VMLRAGGKIPARLPAGSYPCLEAGT